MISRGHGLQREADAVEASQPKSGQQTALRELTVIIRFGADEVDGPPDHGSSDRDTKLLFRLVPEIAQNSRDQFLQSVVAAENFRPPQRPAGQERFERLDQPSFFVGIEITLYRPRAAP